MFELNRDRVETLFNNLQSIIKEVTKVAVKEFNDHDLTTISLDVEIKGRTNGDVKIEFVIGEQYGTNAVRGHNLMSAFEEFARRKGWDTRNAALMISFDTSGRPKEEDHGTYVLEIPPRSDPLSPPTDLDDNTPF